MSAPDDVEKRGSDSESHVEDVEKKDDPNRIPTAEHDVPWTFTRVIAFAALCTVYVGRLVHPGNGDTWLLTCIKAPRRFSTLSVPRSPTLPPTSTPTSPIGF